MTNYVDAKQLLSDAKFYDSYSRFDDSLGRYETWDESVERVMAMHRHRYGRPLANGNGGQLNDLMEEAQLAYRDKLVLGSQRALQFGGEQLLKHNARLYNCVGSYADRPAFFGEGFYLLLCGDGAGFSVQRHHVGKLPSIHQRPKAPKIHVVEDSIEGWATALDALMSSFFESGGVHPKYEGHRVYFDLTQIRPKGAPISGGFLAPGPEPLRVALDRIEYLMTGQVIKTKQAQLRPIHTYDVFMHASDSVLAGGVRRSATICLFSPDDEEMARAKTGNWQVENPQRARSNNSAVIVRDQVGWEEFQDLMGHIREYGEPGFYFVDSPEHITNPCGEIGFLPQHEGESGWQGCNLAEINGGRCTSQSMFYQACRAASIIATLQAGYTDFKFLQPVSKKIFEREALLGVSVTGWMNNPKVLFDAETLEHGAKIVRETNELVAELIGIRPAARLTCGKPSGTASIILMTPSGIHGEHAPMTIRNVQMNKDSEVAKVLKRTNPYMIEESMWSANRTDYVVSFPIIARRGSIFKDDLLGVKHLEMIKLAQKHWVVAGTVPERCVDPTVRHNISNTIVVDDWDAVAEYVFNNRDSFAGITFISQTGDKDYVQAPNVKVMDAREIVKEYGIGGIFGSGLVVEALNAFGNLWTACATAAGIGEDLTILSEDHDNLLKKDWVRRFKKFSANYFEGDTKRAEYCLKDVYSLHRWEKIQQHLVGVDWVSALGTRRDVEIDTLAAVSCHGDACAMFGS
jgi:ribonucleoside-diphosphate reductase alpha chain